MQTIPDQPGCCMELNLKPAQPQISTIGVLHTIQRISFFAVCVVLFYDLFSDFA